MVSSHMSSRKLGQFHYVRAGLRVKSSVNHTYRLRNDILRNRIAVEVIDRDSPESVFGKVVNKELYTRPDEQLT
jgi:hypothetical protein